MSSASQLPRELLYRILELAARRHTLDDFPWTLSLLLLSRSAHEHVAPHVYRSLRICPRTSDAFLSIPTLTRYLPHVRTLQFFNLCDLAHQRAWASAETHIALLAPSVERFRGPRKILSALAKQPTFLPTHWRCDPPMVSASLFGPHEETPRTMSRLTHMYFSFVSPMRVMVSGMQNPPLIAYVCVAPHVVTTPALFLNEVAHGRISQGLQRLVIRLGFMNSAQGKATRVTCAKLLRAAGAKWKDPRIYLDESSTDYDLDDEEQWFIGEQLWRPDADADQ
ncbi:hypothetical protein AURDEDRAFT_184169 [Auricularia subglabra TFB-10046 SS5]|nr:hypothetical protein AURDEDRAFT_184169 [Auricularia subglabra TFB-10046 SS5]